MSFVHENSAAADAVPAVMPPSGSDAVEPSAAGVTPLRPQVASYAGQHYHGVSPPASSGGSANQAGPGQSSGGSRPPDHHDHDHHDQPEHAHGPHDHGLGHGRDHRPEMRRPDGGQARPPVRLLPAATAGPTVVHLSPSLMRMSAGGRLAIAAVLAAIVWAATLSVTG
jgi:hypothetical protein